MIFAGLFTIVLGIGTIMAFIWAGFRRPEYRKIHFTGKTEGTVERLSHITSADITVPLVSYTVDGTKYKVAGPRFAGNTILTLEVGPKQLLSSTCNITPDGELPLVVKAHGDLSAAQQAMNERYPAGKKVEVFYDPANPKKAFVERDAPISKKLASILAGVGGIIVLIGLIVLIAGIMQ